MTAATDAPATPDATPPADEAKDAALLAANYEVARDLLGYPGGDFFARGEIVRGADLGRDAAGLARLIELEAVEPTTKAATATKPGCPAVVPPPNPNPDPDGPPAKKAKAAA